MAVQGQDGTAPLDCQRKPQEEQVEVESKTSDQVLDCSIHVRVIHVGRPWAVLTCLYSLIELPL